MNKDFNRNKQRGRQTVK